MKDKKNLLKNLSSPALLATIVIIAIFIKYHPFAKPGLTPIKATQFSAVVETPAKIDHIFVIVLENKSYSQIVGSKDAPYFNSLAKYFTLVPNYYAVAHPSLPDYLALIGGDTFGIKSDCTNCYLSKSNLVDSLETAGITWKAYMESMPKSCYVGNKGLYAQKHNPFIYFDDIKNDSKRCSNIVPLTELSTDLSSGSAASFVWITPNLCNDMHDCTIQTGDTWLSKQVPEILNSPAFKEQNSLLAILWEEDNGSDKNHVPLLLAPSKASVSVDSSAVYTHYSLLHTIEVLWNLPTLTNNDKSASVFEIK